MDTGAANPGGIVGSGVGTNTSRVVGLKVTNTTGGAEYSKTSASPFGFSSLQTGAVLQGDIQWGGPDGGTTGNTTTSFGVGHDSGDPGSAIGGTDLGPQVGFRGFYSTVDDEVFIRAAGSGALVGVAVPAALPGLDPGDWVELRLVMDLTANGGNGVGSLYYRNLTDSQPTFAPVAGLQNVSLGVLSMNVDSRNPATWDGYYIRMDRFGFVSNPGREMPLDNLSTCSQGCGTSPGTCPTPIWHQVASAGPGPRSGHAMAADRKRGTILLMGGQNSVSPLADTWEWDGSQWSLDTPTASPPARASHAMVYDRARDRVIVFGGRGDSSYLADTWEWNTATWTQAVVSGPAARSLHAMAFDTRRNRTVLFGGFDGTFKGDTWEWDGINWLLRSTTGPSPRRGAAMAFDELREKTVLFGGENAGGGLADTWEWDGTTWTQIATSSQPAARSAHAMAFSSNCARVVLYGGTGSDTNTWHWDGIQWLSSTATVGLRTSTAMAFDISRGEPLLFGGTNGTNTLYGDTYGLCSPCDDEAAALDSAGNVIFPPTFDPTGPVTYSDVDTVLGNVTDLYPGFGAKSDTWYNAFPCDPAIGGTVPQDASNPAIQDSLAADSIFASPQAIADSMTSWEGALASMVASAPDSLVFAGAIGTDTLYSRPFPHCPPAIPGWTYVFGGRDIIFVHGLKFDHLLKKMIGNQRAAAKWQHASQFPAKSVNPEFYEGGLFKDSAHDTWDDHIKTFLTDRHIANRYLIVSYACTERLEQGIQAILTQISDAMRYGTDVEGPWSSPSGPPNVPSDSTNFGTPSFVVVSHSTGGLATDAAMYAAANYPNLKAQFIPNQCKAHIALTGAFEGSRFATAAIVASGVLSYVTVQTVPWLCPLVQIALGALQSPGPEITLPTCPSAFAVAQGSILMDLVPLITQARWGQSVGNSPVRTVNLIGGHPSFMFPLKTILHPGFDDGVLNIGSESANPNSAVDWPSGFTVKNGVLGLAQTYDMGVARISPARARLYYVDQVFEKFYNPFTAFKPNYVASGATPYLSPTGMLQSVGSEFAMTSGFNPLRRHSGHYSFIQCASDHLNWTAPDNGNDYHKTFGDRNAEETRVIREDDEGALYAPYAMHYANDSQALLTTECVPKVEEIVEGHRVDFSIQILFRKYTKHWWIWKRRYHRLVGSDTKLAAQFAYESILYCAPTIATCAVGAVDDGSNNLGFSASNRPNPFTSSTSIDYTLPATSHVELAIHDVMGRRVRLLVSGAISAGRHSVIWDGTDDARGRVVPGLYFWTLRVAGKQVSKKAIMIR